MFLSVLAGALFSCEDLDQFPDNLYPSSVVFDTPVRVEQQVNGLYDAVKDGNFLGSRVLIYNDIRGEEFVNRLTNGVTGLQTWNFTTVESTNEVNNTWTSAYLAINQINIFLQGLDDNVAKFVQPVFPATFAATATNYRAEARFLRAVSYYYLLQLYAKPYANNNGANPGLPLRLKGERDFNDNDLARSSVADVYNQILTDLDYAEANLPLTGTTFRAHRNTAIAFKTRVYLTMGAWDKVITEADKIVSAAAPFTATTGTAHRLGATYNAPFATPYTTAESIFSFPFTALDAPGTQNQLGYYYLPAVTATVRATPNTNAGNGEYPLNERAPAIYKDASFAPTDLRRNFISYVYTRNSAEVITDTVYYLNKYSSASPYTDASPVIRYAEVLLNLAEARAKDNGGSIDARAIELLNAVRTRSAGSAYAAGDFADSNALVTAILKERRIEFLGEGLRSIDITRLQQTFPRKGTIAPVEPTSPNYIWPMPSTERNTNQLLQPN